jgi:hypothetical protein
MKFNLSSKIGSSMSRMFPSAEAESIYEAPEVAEPVFWVVFSFAILLAALCAPLRRWL